MSDLTPYARAQKLAHLGMQPKAIVAELIKDGIADEEAKLAVHALQMEPSPPSIANDVDVSPTILGGPGLVLSWNRGSWFDAQLQIAFGTATVIFSLLALGWAVAAPGKTPLFLGLIAVLISNFLLSRILKLAGTLLLLAISLVTLWTFSDAELLGVAVTATTTAVGMLHIANGLRHFLRLEKERNVMRLPENLAALPVAEAKAESAPGQQATGT